jgi:hypothetical protein
MNVALQAWSGVLSGGFEMKSFHRYNQAVHHRHDLLGDKHAGRM